MKKKPPDFVDQFLACLLPHGPISARAMFGGWGIYYDDVIFAIIVEKQLYFRIDENSRADFESRGSKQFIYEGMKGPVGMPYFTVPDSILKNPKELKQWIDRAYLASLSSKKSSKRSKQATRKK
ncbi:MAG: TfoX/Sxy family protein [Verrucomicrobia bacterium]|nr:TfoX/Sxy family protein [Verrucomicrobiota bacterium]